MKNWKFSNLKDVCDVFTDGDWIESKDQDSEGIRLIQTGNIGEGIFKNRLDKSRYINQATFKKLNCKNVYPGDCLISRLPDPVGRSCIVPDIKQAAITAVDCTIVRFTKEKVDPGFFVYYSQFRQYLQDIHVLCTGTTRKRISRKNLGKIKIPVPSLEEQKRIVEILDESFAGIERAEAIARQNLTNARELFDSYFNKIFTKNNHQWKIVNLDQVASFRNGLNFTKNSQGESIKIVGVKDFQDFFWLDLDNLESVTIDGGLKKFDILKENDIIVVRSNGNRELIGRCILAGKISEKISHSGFTIRVRIDDNTIFHPFVVYFLKSEQTKRQLINSGGGISISSISQKSLSSIKLRLPSLEEQKRIVSKLDEIKEYSQKLEEIYQRKIEALGELKQSILQKAFSGQLTQ
jgi:type I restriction enzyme S subunit